MALSTASDGGPSDAIDERAPTDAPLDDLADAPLEFVGVGARTGLWAIADQLLFAGANFAISVALARLSPLADYGAFATASALLLLLGLAHTAVLTEPMLVFGATAYADAFPRYLKRLVRGHWMVTGASAVPLLAVAGVVGLGGDQRLAWALAGLAIASPAILSLWLLRRAFYLINRTRDAALGGAAYLVLTLAGLFAASRVVELTSPVAFAIMALSSCAVYLWFRRVLQWPSAAALVDDPRGDGQTVAREHWAYGQWALLATAALWVPTNVYFLIIPSSVSLEQVGELRMVMNLLMLLIHLLSPLSLVFLPSLSRHFAAARAPEDIDTVRRAATKTLAFFIGLALVVFAGLAALSPLILRILYGSAYSGGRLLPTLVGVLALPTAAGVSYRTVLRAVKRPKATFFGYAAGCVVTAIVGIPLWLASGPRGALYGMIIAGSISTAHLWWSYRSAVRAEYATLSLRAEA